MGNSRPNCQQQSGIQNLITVRDLFLIAKDFSFTTLPPLLIPIATAVEPILTFESQALLRLTSRLSHHVTIAPQVVLINSVRLYTL